MMRKFLFCALCCCLVAVSATAWDPTKPTDVQAMSGIDPFHRAPGPGSEAGSGCWYYGSDSNYSWGDICTYSTTTCKNACIDSEQQCVQACYVKCGNTSNTNGSCFENCGDDCRTKYNSCVNAC